MELFLLAALIPFASSSVNRHSRHSLVELSVNDVVAESCHSSVTLHCNITQKKVLREHSLSWIRASDNKILCTVGTTDAPRNYSHRIQCRSAQAQLALTIAHLWPTDQGKYICKLQSNLGMKTLTSEVKVKECYGGVHSVPSASEVTCHFYGVYPQGKVHWFHQEKNVTVNSVAANCSKPNHRGMYNVSSTLQTKYDSNKYNCSLWIPSTGNYLTSTLVYAPVIEPRSAHGKAVSLHMFGLGWYLLQATVLIALHCFSPQTLSSAHRPSL